ncbi:MAG: CapA family protein [Eubacterium sp.]|nr:CapA family protein [Eubacterium sp.]
MKNRRNFIIIFILAALLIAAAAVFISAKSEQTANNPEAFISEEVENLIINKDITAPYGIDVLRSSDNGIQVYWKKPENVKGYVIYRSYEKDGNFKLLDYIDESELFRDYFDTTFDASKKAVYYCVRAVREVDGRDTYSELSGIAVAKYKDSLKLSRSKIFMFSGAVRQVSAYYGWTNAHGVKWTSDNESIAKVNQNGEITGVSKGVTYIRCSLPEKDLSAEVKITVDREDEKMLSESLEHRYELNNGIYTNPEAEKKNEAVIMMAGDLMALAPHMKACRTDEGVYDFRPCYEYVKPLLAQSDLNIGNLEAMIASEYSYGIEESKVDDRPNANTCATLLDALMYAGFDALPMSNNHNADCGPLGVKSTVDTLDRYKFPHTGVFKSGSDKRYIIFDVNGIKVGITSYTTQSQPGFNHRDANWDKNDVDTLLNYYSKEKAEADLKEMKKDGAEFCIVYIHWGIKNFFEPTDDQTEKAQELADMGYDYIAGAHSHTIQKYDEITSDDGRKVPCIYSLGDFNSHLNQIEGNRDTLIMRLKLIKNNGGKIEIAENNYIPVYIYTKYKGKPYVSIPLNPDINGNITDLYNQMEFAERIAEEAGGKIKEYKR